MVARSRLGAVVVLGALLGCDARAALTRPTSGGDRAVASQVASAAPAPANSARSDAASNVRPAPAGATVALDVAGFAAAAVAVPDGGARRSGVVIAAHGNYDRPEWECDFWKRLFEDAFVLCPRGIERLDADPGEDRYTYASAAALEAEVDASVRALEARFGEAVDARAMTWVGLSRGAFLGAVIAARHPARFPRVLLVEGGHDPWTPERAVAFAKGGGQRVQFVCGQRSCTLDARQAASRLERAGVSTRVDEVIGMGHGLNVDVDRYVHASMDMLAPALQAPARDQP
jgi:predicted esterase